MFRLTITAGTQYDRNGKELESFPAKLRAIRAHMAATFGGFTEEQTFGGWINDAGELVMEPGRRWDILTDLVANESAARLLARQTAELVAAVLNQASVLAEVHGVSAEFVPQPAANDNLPAVEAAA